MKKTKQNKLHRKQKKDLEKEEIELLESWIEFGKPDSGWNPLSLPPLPSDAPVGRIDESTFSRYAGCTKFDQLPVSKKTKDGLRDAKFKRMTDIQRAALPHALCGRDILGAAKTGSGKTLAFIIPVLENLYRAGWRREFGVGCIILSPTRDLAGQLYEVLNVVGKYHDFSSGLLVGQLNDYEVEKERVNELNILVCTPGRLLMHMNSTPNFHCSDLQVLVLDEADRILDAGFKKEVNAIIAELPKKRQTFLFSATQTKSVKDLARLSLKDPEYLSVHEEAIAATPNRLQQKVIIVPLDQKLDMLWSFIKAHLNSRIIVFLSSCKQVRFAFEAFKKLRPGIPLKCLHGRMKAEKRMGIYSEFCEKRSVLFSTDVAARGLDFNKTVDWVVQVDCPEDVATYIHRVGRTARHLSSGRSLLFLTPSEMKMLEKLREKKIPVQFDKANTKRLQPVSGLLAALLVKYTALRDLAQKAFITYLRSIHKRKDKEVFDVMKLPIVEFSASLGLPMTPKVSFLNHKTEGNGLSEKLSLLPEVSSEKDLVKISRERPNTVISEKAEEERELDLLLKEEIPVEEEGKASASGVLLPATRVLKKKKLKINVHRPVGTRVVFDEEGNTLPPLARLADMTATDSARLDKDKVNERYAKLKEEMKVRDKEDKLVEKQRRKEKRIKAKEKWKRGRNEEEDEEGLSESETGAPDSRRSKKYFDSDSDDGNKNGSKGLNADSISIAEQEELALKLLSSMHS